MYQIFFSSVIILDINLLNRNKQFESNEYKRLQTEKLIVVFAEYKYIFIPQSIKEHLWANGQNIKNNSLTKIYLKKYYN